jgi:coenzyme Q-binding protein COQ10
MISQSIEIKASPKKCYNVIWDFENYPEFVKDLNDVEVKGKRGNSCEVTYHIKVIKDISYTLKLKGKPSSQIEWTFVEGDFMKENKGYWELEEVKKGVTMATYNIHVKFGLLVPGSVTKKLVGSSLPSMLKSFKKRIEAKK